MSVATRISLLADVAESDGVDVDGSVGGSVHNWVLRRVDCQQSQVFFVVFLLTAELADRAAFRCGYRDQCDRAAQLAFKNRG